MHVCMYVCMHACMDICMYVCTCVRTFNFCIVGRRESMAPTQVLFTLKAPLRVPYEEKDCQLQTCVLRVAPRGNFGERWSSPTPTSLH